MSDEHSSSLVEVLVIIVVTAIVCGLIYGGVFGTQAQVKREAVDLGHAEWRLDSAGRPKFYWFDCGRK